MEPNPLHPTLDADPSPTEALSELHTRLLDTVAGFDKALEKAEPDFARIVRAFLDLHRDHANATGDMLARAGHDPGRDGSVFGTVNRGLVEVRSWFDRIDIEQMDALVQAEKHLLEAFDIAIASIADDQRKAALGAMRDAQIALMDQHCPPS
ncbi:MAG: protein of unknown function containing DUF2383 domain [Rhodobacteraceae bacterium HLUCCA12]|nr:MAG: protein of unknown function containing DUF2383 domain [Rhodobacteraceae bacterium HLUCCA12]